jgi:hypothetical protein
MTGKSQGGASVDRRQFLQGSSALGATLLLAHDALGRTGVGTARAPLAGPPVSVAPLLQPRLEDSLDARCRAKRVLASRLLDDMEHNTGWTASAAVTLEYTHERSRSGTRSLRLRTLLRNEDYIRQARAPNGTFTGSAVLFDGTPFSASAGLRFDPPQDWSAYNRLSLWCFLHASGNPINSLSLQFLCDGAPAGPADPISVHYFSDLEQGEWNHLVWEIPEFRRDRVSQLVLFQPISGVPNRHAEAAVIYDLDELRLERVDAEVVQGWQVPNGTIAYSHVGYQPEASKIAICGGSGAELFSLHEAHGGREVARLPTRAIHNARGDFRVLDFSAYTRPGRYRLRCGTVQSEPFSIAAGVWRTLTEQILNGFSGLRCGCAVPGVHDACHLDVFVEYRGERRVVGGGWHDAANLTQGPGRTHLSCVALLRLYEQLSRLRVDPALADRARAEALWGLEWSLRLRFGPGIRCLYGDYSYYTDGIPGTLDDVMQQNVGEDLFQNILAVLATATAARVLGDREPHVARRALRAAIEDYAALRPQMMTPPRDAPPIDINEGSWRDRIGYLTLAAVELHRCTGDAHYRTDAKRFARWLMELQEQRFLGGSPVTGYFYEDAGRTRIVHEFHSSFEESGLLALQALCETWPSDADWMQWYAALLIYSEYFCRSGSRASAPFDMIPAAVWRRADLDAALPVDRMGKVLAAHPNPVFPTAPTREQSREQMLRMFEAGERLTDDTRLRMFPLWHNHVQHGASVVHLSKNAGLLAAAQVRGSRVLAELAARQMQWLLGANPFSRSLIYGVGYDYWQNFCVSLPNLVGGMSLGFNSYQDDAPAWGNNAVFPYKEQWVYASCRLALNLAQLGMPVRIRGVAGAGADFREERTGTIVSIPAGRFDRVLPAGAYTVSYGGIRRRLELVEGRDYGLTLDPQSAILIELEAAPSGPGFVDLSVRTRGRGTHALELRTFNLRAPQARRQVSLEPDVASLWTQRFAILESDKPWVLVVVPDGEMDARQELWGAVEARGGDA